MADPYEHDPGMRALLNRDLRNSATPVHVPVVQGRDFDAAEDEGRLDETSAITGDGVEGDADFAVEAHEKQEEDKQAVEDALDHIEDEPVVDNTSPAGDDAESPVNAFGNVAPDTAVEENAEPQPAHAAGAETATTNTGVGPDAESRAKAEPTDG